MMIRSVSHDQDEILQSIVGMHCPDGIDVDLTYGNGCFYEKIGEPKNKFDISPQVSGVIAACSTNVPLPSMSVVSVVFDPPFLTYIKAGREHGSIMAKRFSGYWRYDELVDHYTKTIAEANRVLRDGSIFVIKCQDIIHNHKMHATHVNVVRWCEENGMRLLDLYVLVAKHRMGMPEQDGAVKRKQKHARVFHSYFLVFKKQGRA